MEPFREGVVDADIGVGPAIDGRDLFRLHAASEVRAADRSGCAQASLRTIDCNRKKSVSNSSEDQSSAGVSWVYITSNGGLRRDLLARMALSPLRLRNFVPAAPACVTDFEAPDCAVQRSMPPTATMLFVVIGWIRSDARVAFIMMRPPLPPEWPLPPLALTVHPGPGPHHWPFTAGSLEWIGGSLSSVSEEFRWRCTHPPEPPPPPNCDTIG